MAQSCCSPLLSPNSGSASRSSVRELAKGLACIVGGALGVGIGMKIPDVPFGVAIALTAVVVGIVAFMLFTLALKG